MDPHDHPLLDRYPSRPRWATSWPQAQGRPLTGPEIVQLEAFGCSARDWSGVTVADRFDPDSVRRTHFAGRVFLGVFDGLVDHAGVLLPSGVYDAVVADSEVHSGARVARVGLMSGCRVASGALVAHCDEVLGLAGSTFGNGLGVGLHAANADRSIPVVADLPFDVLAGLVRPRPSSALLGALSARAKAYSDACQSDFTFIGPDARVTGCRRVSGAFIAAGCVVSGATALHNVTLLSEGDDRARVGAGTIVRNALLQWNAVVEDGAFVEDSLLAEASTVTRHGIVTGSAIGPNTTIAEGEVSASVVGPFAGFNHQALLVSACWPEGRGNIGYGANVGSNHTGRAPDQEIHPGEGTFFGLGVNVKMPADFSAAPYTVIATGVDTLPQRVEMPFSLIVGSESGALNRIVPGWGLRENLYGLFRNVWKFQSRNRALRTPFDADAFRLPIAQLCDAALRQLKSAEGLPWYSDKQIRGIGKNLLSESDRLAGIANYENMLRWFGLRAYVRAWDTAGSPPRPSDVPFLSRYVTATDPGVVLDLYLDAERQRLAGVLTSKAKDDSRGARTIEDYVQVHTPAADDPLYLWARDRFEEIAARVAALRERAV